MDLADVASLALDNFRVHATEPSRGIAEARIEESSSLMWVDAGLDWILRGIRVTASQDVRFVELAALGIGGHP